MDYYARCRNARQTCRYFGISAQTFYRWKNRYDPYDLTTLEEESRRPRRVRGPETSERVVEPENVRQASTAAADFLYHLKMKLPFRIKAIQIDGGSEFMDQFEEAYRRARIQLFLNPTRHPEMKGGVERSNRTHREEFYEVEDVSLDVEEHNKQLAKYESL
jgi:hypothetical protein